MLYGQATLKEAQKIVKTLSEFNQVAGTKINKEKTKVFFFNTSLAIQIFLACTTGFKIGTLLKKYLGIMLNEHQFRTVNWEPLIKKIRNRMENWTFRSLNAPNQLILLKAILWLSQSTRFLVKLSPSPLVKRWSPCSKAFFGREPRRLGNGS